MEIEFSQYLDDLTCRACKIELTDDMEIEFSQHLDAFFCSPDCAIDYYFDYMRSSPLDLDDKQFFKDKNVKVVKGKLKKGCFDMLQELVKEAKVIEKKINRLMKK